MKSVSDLVWEFLYQKGIDKVFYVSGGGCIFLLDALGRNGNITPIAVHHEQTAALAAEGWARETGKVGVCLVTSGPGGTNALTGTLCSYLDSIPVIVISGNVNKEMTTEWSGQTDDWDSQLRQLGDQEFNIVKTAKTMTKWAMQINEPTDIRLALETAYYEATSGRPGPVWIDVPLNVQSHKMDDSQIKELIGGPSILKNYKHTISDKTMDSIVAKWNESKRPLVIAGNGIRLSGGVQEFRELMNELQVPVVTAVNGNDVINHDYAHYCGRFGTHAQIAANKIIQEADFIVTIGSRLYVRQTGYNFKEFGKNAYHVHLDIDDAELHKHTIRSVTHQKVCGDAKEFIRQLSKRQIHKTNEEWLSYCHGIIDESPTVLQRHRDKKEYASSYALLEKLNQHLPANYDVVTSDGSANVVTMQVLRLKGNQRLFTNTGAAPMGYGLPAAIGAASTGNNILCIEGDGSIHLNIQELQTVKHLNLPLKILIINNDGYLSIKVTQKTFFDGRFLGTDKNSGLSFPNYKKLIEAYELPYFCARHNSDVGSSLKQLFSIDGPAVLEIFTDPNEYHEPKVVAKLGDDGKFIPGALENIQWLE